MTIVVLDVLTSKKGFKKKYRYDVGICMDGEVQAKPITPIVLRGWVYEVFRSG